MKITYTYYSSDILENMLFKTEEDAKDFDNTLEDFINSSESIDEFKKLLNHYASYVSVRNAINRGEFHYGLAGIKSYKLILACEKMVNGRNGLGSTEYYKEALLYILNYIVKNDKEEMDN